MITDNPNGLPDIAIYTALLTQSGTNPPDVIVLQNTLRKDVVWTRAALGSYVATVDEAQFFAREKTTLQVTQTFNMVSTYMLHGHTNYDFVRLFTYSEASGVFVDGSLFYTTVEIRVYNENFI